MDRNKPTGDIATRKADHIELVLVGTSNSSDPPG
jgi:hypothetical protein